MKTRVVVLGAGFGGLELTTILSDTFGDAIDIVLIDKVDVCPGGGSIWRRCISSIAVTPALIATFRPGVQAWKRSCNSVLTTVPKNTT